MVKMAGHRINHFTLIGRKLTWDFCIMVIDLELLFCVVTFKIFCIYCWRYLFYFGYAKPTVLESSFVGLNDIIGFKYLTRILTITLCSCPHVPLLAPPSCRCEFTYLLHCRLPIHVICKSTLFLLLVCLLTSFFFAGLFVY